MKQRQKALEARGKRQKAKLGYGLFPCLLLHSRYRLVNEGFPSTYLIFLFLFDVFKHFLFNLKTITSEEQVIKTQS